MLLNSDALLPNDWAHRLIYPLQQDPKIASVTPLSNDAEIFNVPFVCARSDLKAGESDLIDASLRQTISANAFEVAPTGVGFCMAINRKFLSKIPVFDQAFGRGYGEEVDWCQKVAALGGSHVVQPNLFVEHRGGASFGSAAKQAAIERNNGIISQRYPNYDRSVQRFISSDPIRTARVFAAFAKLAANQDVIDVYIAHSLGGGAEQYLKEKIATSKEAGLGLVVLRLGGQTRWRLEAHMTEGTAFGETDDLELVQQFLQALPNVHMIYSCAVGDKDPASLPKM